MSFSTVTNIAKLFEKWIMPLLKFSFSKKATKFETIFHFIWRVLSKYQIKWKIILKFCGLLRMSELYNILTWKYLKGDVRVLVFAIGSKVLFLYLE